MGSEQAGAGYLVELYRDVEALNGFLPQYLNLIVGLRGKYGDLTEDNWKKIELEEQDKQRALQVVPPLRHLTVVIVLKMNALESRISEFASLSTDEKFLKAYEIVTVQSMPDYKIVYHVALEINKCFVSGVVDDLLRQAQSIHSLNTLPSGAPLQ